MSNLFMLQAVLAACAISLIVIGFMAIPYLPLIFSCPTSVFISVYLSYFFVNWTK